MVAKAQEVGISCRAVRLCIEEAKELRSLENKPLRIVASLQSGQKTTQCELLQQRGLGDSLLACLIPEAILE